MVNREMRNCWYCNFDPQLTYKLQGLALLCIWISSQNFRSCLVVLDH